MEHGFQASYLGGQYHPALMATPQWGQPANERQRAFLPGERWQYRAQGSAGLHKGLLSPERPSLHEAGSSRKAPMWELERAARKDISVDLCAQIAQDLVWST